MGGCAVPVEGGGGLRGGGREVGGTVVPGKGVLGRAGTAAARPWGDTRRVPPRLKP